MLDHPDARPRLASRVDQAIDGAVTLGLAVLILVGFATSYRTLLDLAATVGGYPRWLAPAVPLSFDLGIVVLSLKVTRSARDGRTAPVLRLLVATLSTATVIANASAANTPAARLLHAVPPAMFVICFESVIFSARRRALAEQGLLPQPLPRQRLASWLLAPRTTWRRWRSTVLASADPAPLTAPSAVLPKSKRVQPLIELTPVRKSDRGPRQGIAAHRPASALRRERDAQILTIVSAEPDLTASQLAQRVDQLGHRISLRTAQRIKASLTSRSLSSGSSDRPDWASFNA